MTCHCQIRPDRLVEGEGEQGGDDGASSGGAILRCGAGRHMHVDGGLAEELGGRAHSGREAAREGVRDVCTLLHDIAQLTCKCRSAEFEYVH